MKLLRQLWNDEAGFVVSSELVLIATILVIGLVVGLTSLRNQVVQELTDTGQAIGAVSQGYTFYGTSKASVAQTDATSWDDHSDFCQVDPANVDTAFLTEPGGISVREAPTPTNESTPGEQL